MTRDSIPRDDLYGELEVSRQASVAAIEAAYRRLVKQHHPDVGRSDDLERIKRLNLAREWLTDLDRRRQYDLSRGISPTSATAHHWTVGSADGGRAWPAPRAARSAPEDASEPVRTFGVNANEVRIFLAGLRGLDSERARRVFDGRAVAHAKGYTVARRVAAQIGQSKRKTEWQLAREAASVIARGKLGDTMLTEQVVDVLADAAGAIAIRDLLSDADYSLVLLPWTWTSARVDPATAPKATPAAAARPTPTRSVAAPPTVPPSAPTPAAAAPSMPTPIERTAAAAAPSEPTPIEPTPSEPTPIEPTPIEPTPIEPMPIEAIGTPLSEKPQPAPRDSPVAPTAGGPQPDAAPASRDAPTERTSIPWPAADLAAPPPMNAAPPVAAAASAASLPPPSPEIGRRSQTPPPSPESGRPSQPPPPAPEIGRRSQPPPPSSETGRPSQSPPAPARPTLRPAVSTDRPTLSPGPPVEKRASLQGLGVSPWQAPDLGGAATTPRAATPNAPTRAAVFGVVATSRRPPYVPAAAALLVVLALVGVVAGLVPPREQDVASITDAPTGANGEPTGFVVAPFGSTAPTTDPTTTDATATDAVVTPGEEPTQRPAVDDPTVKPPPPEPDRTPKPPKPTPTPDTSTPAPAPTPTPPAPTPTPEPECLVPNFVNTQPSQVKANQKWADAGFTGGVIFDGAFPPGSKILWQSIPAGTTVPCSSSITVSDVVPPAPGR